MRLILLLIAFERLVLAVNCEDNDDMTARWIMCNSTIPGLTDNPMCSNDPVEEKGTTKTNLSPKAIDETIECTTAKDEEGNCVLYFECLTKIDEDEESSSNSCPTYLHTCCKKSDIEIKGPSKTDDKDGQSNDKDDIGSRNIDGTTESTLKECGWNNPNISYTPQQTAELELTMANYGDFPWIVAVMKKSDVTDVWSQADYLGGGILIHPSVVITVAHLLTIKKKLLGPDKIKCRAGEYDTQSTLEPYPAQEQSVEKYYIHEKYYRPSLYNDIALLILEGPFNLQSAPHIGTACLAKALPAEDSACFGTGWGRAYKRKEFAAVLRKLKFKFVNHKKCKRLLMMNSRLGLGPFELHESLTCAGGELGVDTCTGGKGSPLVCPVATNGGNIRYEVIGMMAYGMNCTTPAIPMVYANVPHLRSWVNEKMQLEGIDDHSYTI